MKRIISTFAALAFFLTIGSGTARALSVTWAFLFPIPLPLPVWAVDHPHSLVTIGFLFPIWLPLPFYNYNKYGPVEPKFSELKDGKVPADAVAYIDGKDMGPALKAEAKPPELPDGKHTFELRENGRTIYLAEFNIKDGRVAQPDKE